MPLEKAIPPTNATSNLQKDQFYPSPTPSMNAKENYLLTKVAAAMPLLPPLPPNSGGNNENNLPAVPALTYIDSSKKHAQGMRQKLSKY